MAIKDVKLSTLVSRAEGAQYNFEVASGAVSQTANNLENLKADLAIKKSRHIEASWELLSYLKRLNAK